MALDLQELAKQIGDQTYPPVEKWNPDLCGDIDMRIARDGTWYYMGSPIGRKRLVKLFSSVLRKDSDGHHYLVTPVEKLKIKVDVAPLIVVELSEHIGDMGPAIAFRTLTDDHFLLDEDHPLRVELDSENKGPVPFVLVRGALEALIGRPIFYELVNLADGVETKGGRELVVRSCGQSFSLGRVESDV